MAWLSWIWLTLSSKHAKKAIPGHFFVKKYIFAIARQMGFSWWGVRVGQVKVIFALPQTIYTHGSLNEINAPAEWKGQGPLAYVEWYANLPASADPVHMMYEVRKLPLHVDGTPAGEIIPLSMIRQSCQLIPHFPRPTRGSTISTIPSDWTSDSVLDKAQRFLLNNWATKYAYQTLW